MSKLQLYVKGITGTTIPISCLNDIKIRGLKNLISNEIGNENETTHYYMIKFNEEVETFLMKIKRHWNLNNNWSRDLHLRDWDRIEVNEDSKEKFIVKTFNLSNSQLTGEIPKEIGNLINLKNLYLFNNELTGKIPKE